MAFTTFHLLAPVLGETTQIFFWSPPIECFPLHYESNFLFLPSKQQLGLFSEDILTQAIFLYQLTFLTSMSMPRNHNHLLHIGHPHILSLATMPKVHNSIATMNKSYFNMKSNEVLTLSVYANITIVLTNL